MINLFIYELIHYKLGIHISLMKKIGAFFIKFKTILLLESVLCKIQIESQINSDEENN